MGLSLFLANSLTGWLFELYGVKVAFIGSAAIAMLAICLLPMIPAKTSEDYAIIY